MTGYAVARIWPVADGRSAGDNLVVEWPYPIARNHEIERLGPVRDTLAEAQADARLSIPR